MDWNGMRWDAYRDRIEKRSTVRNLPRNNALSIVFCSARGGSTPRSMRGERLKLLWNLWLHRSIRTLRYSSDAGKSHSACDFLNPAVNFSDLHNNACLKDTIQRLVVKYCWLCDTGIKRSKNMNWSIWRILNVSTYHFPSILVDFGLNMKDRRPLEPTVASTLRLESKLPNKQTTVRVVMGGRLPGRTFRIVA